MYDGALGKIVAGLKRSTHLLQTTLVKKGRGRGGGIPSVPDRRPGGEITRNGCKQARVGTGWSLRERTRCGGKRKLSETPRKATTPGVKSSPVLRHKLKKWQHAGEKLLSGARGGGRGRNL